jgi:hypothetical protein
MNVLATRKIEEAHLVALAISEVRQMWEAEYRPLCK